MSYAAVIGFGEDGDAFEIEECGNAMQGAYLLWLRLAEKYGVKFSLFDEGRGFWEACNSGRFNERDTLACKLTYDNVIVAHRNIPRAIEAWEPWCSQSTTCKACDWPDTHMSHPHETVSQTTIAGLVKYLRDAFRGPPATEKQVIAVGFHHTSVIQNPWVVCEGEEYRPYNLFRDEGHWELLGDKIDRSPPSLPRAWMARR